MTIESDLAPSSLRSRRLAHLVATAAQATTAQVADDYELTAVVIERPIPDADSRTVVVELVHDRHNAEHRWSAQALDELRGMQTPLSYGRSAKQAIAGIPWSELEQ